MAKPVIMGAMMSCSEGTAPASLIVTPGAVTIEGMPAATIMDFAPISNIPTFVMCNTQANPAVAAATAAASGTPTPAPCVPATVAPWSSGASKVVIGGIPVLTEDCECMCAYTGTISFDSPGTSKTEVE